MTPETNNAVSGSAGGDSRSSCSNSQPAPRIEGAKVNRKIESEAAAILALYHTGVHVMCEWTWASVRTVRMQYRYTSLRTWCWATGQDRRGAVPGVNL